MAKKSSLENFASFKQMGQWLNVLPTLLVIEMSLVGAVARETVFVGTFNALSPRQ